MAKGYRPVDRDQQFLLPPDMREWLPAEHPVWLVISVVSESLDTTAFHAGRLGGAGRAGFDPQPVDAVDLGLVAGGAVVAADRAVVSQDVAFR